MTLGWGQALTLVRLLAAGVLLWILPWWRMSGALGPSDAASRASLSFLLGVAATVISSYGLIIMGVYSPAAGLIAHIAVAMAAMAAYRRSVSSSAVGWPMGLALGAGLALRLPDALRHLALGGNDPWGHLVLCKALAAGDPIAAFHDFSFYPRGYHALVLTLHAATGLSPYEVMRLFGPLLALMGITGAYAVARRASTSFGGYVAAFVYAVPAYRHLVLPSLQTSLEPDRFAFAFLPALLLLLMDAVDRGSHRATAVMLGAGMVHVLIHPLSVQFLVAWIACGALVAWVFQKRLPAAQVMGGGLLVTLFAWAYYHVTYRALGIAAMPHLSPGASFSVGGHGVDLRRILVGTGWYVEWHDAASVLIIAFLGIAAFRRRNVPTGLLALVLAHTAYAAGRDACYLGDFGHAPPYYAMALAWAAGALAGQEALLPWRRLLPPAGMVILTGHRLVSGGPTPQQGMLLAMMGAVTAAGLLSPRLRDGLVAAFVGLALCSLRPQPVAYARLGYPEAVEWAHLALSGASGCVYSEGLISRMPDGRPFPTQDPVASIVWPHHEPRRLSRLLGEPACTRWTDGIVLAMVETAPYAWGFPFFAQGERDGIMEAALHWLHERRRCGAPLRIVRDTGRMMLVALHDEETT